MKCIKFNPIVKMIIFIIVCIFCMNVTQNFELMMLGTGLWILLIVAGVRKESTIMYLVFMGSNFFIHLILTYSTSNLMISLSSLLIYFRVFIPMMMAFCLVFQTTTISEFMAAFQKINAPSSMVIPFVVFFRFMPTVQEEWRGIRQAMAFRGIGLKFSSIVFHPIQTAEYILVPLLFSCVQVMDELVAASLARGLDSDKKRTCFLEVSMKLQDYFILVAILGFVTHML